MKRTITKKEVKKYINQEPAYPLSNHEEEVPFRPQDKFFLIYKIRNNLQNIIKESAIDFHSALDEFENKFELIEKRYPVAVDRNHPDCVVDLTLDKLNEYNAKRKKSINEDYKKIKKELDEKRQPYYPILFNSSIDVNVDEKYFSIHSLIEKLDELIDKENAKEMPFRAVEPFSDPVIKVINEVIHFLNFNRKYRKNVANLNRPTFSNCVEYLFMQLEKYIDYFSALNMNYRIIRNEEVKELYDVSIFGEEEISKFPYQ